MVASFSRGTRVLFALLFVIYTGCSTPAQRAASAPEPSDLVIMQINDVYELDAIEGGRFGGLARVAGLKKQLLRENPNTVLVIAGDFLSPSALGVSVVDGRKLAGRQIVDTFNVMGMNIASFGNHEFDLKEADLRQRIKEMQFELIAGNIHEKTGGPFAGLRESTVREFKLNDGRAIRVGFVAVTTTDATKLDYSDFKDPIASIKEQVMRLNGRADIIVGLSHQSWADDAKLAEAVPELNLIMGGHDHENGLIRKGAHLTPIAKADANARSAFIHRIRLTKGAPRAVVKSELVPLDSSVPVDEATAARTKSWIEKAFDGFRAIGFDPTRVVAVTTQPLDGREAKVRNEPTTLTEALARAILLAMPSADASIYNSGNIRVDDVILPGPLTEYDVIRILPFGGYLGELTVTGAKLSRLLDENETRHGNGMYLQVGSIARAKSGWTVQGKPIDPKRTYKLASNDYTTNYLKDFAVPGSVKEHKDIEFRRVLIRYLETAGSK